MARVTVEDCLRNVRNRFELVIVAAKRARQLMRGKEAKVEWDNDKPTVVALREIAAGLTTVNSLNTPDTHEQDLPVVQASVEVEIEEINIKESLDQPESSNDKQESQ